MASLYASSPQSPMLGNHGDCSMAVETTGWPSWLSPGTATGAHSSAYSSTAPLASPLPYATHTYLQSDGTSVPMFNVAQELHSASSAAAAQIANQDVHPSMSLLDLTTPQPTHSLNIETSPSTPKHVELAASYAATSLQQCLPARSSVDGSGGRGAFDSSRLGADQQSPVFNSSNHRASVYSQSGIGMQVHGDEAKEHGVNMEDTLGGALRDHRHYSLQTLSSRLGSPVAIHSIYAAQLNAFSPETQQAARGEHFTMHQSHSHESVNGLGLNDSELESMLKAQQLLTAQPQKTKMELALLASRLEQTSLARQGRLEPLQHRAQQASAHVLRQDIRVPDSDAIPQRNITHSNYGSASSQFHLPDVQHQVAALDPSPALAHALLRDEATRAAGGSVARALGPSSMFERGEAHIVKQEGQAELDAVRNSASNQLTSGIQQAEHGMGPKPESTSLHGDPSLASPMLTDSACTKTLSTSSRRVKPEQRKCGLCNALSAKSHFRAVPRERDPFEGRISEISPEDNRVCQRCVRRLRRYTGQANFELTTEYFRAQRGGSSAVVKCTGSKRARVGEPGASAHAGPRLLMVRTHSEDAFNVGFIGGPTSEKHRVVQELINPQLRFDEGEFDQAAAYHLSSKPPSVAAAAAASSVSTAADRDDGTHLLEYPCNTDDLSYASLTSYFAEHSLLCVCVGSTLTEQIKILRELQTQRVVVIYTGMFACEDGTWEAAIAQYKDDAHRYCPNAHAVIYLSAKVHEGDYPHSFHGRNQDEWNQLRALLHLPSVPM